MLSEEQKLNRRKGIGASEAAIVMGLSTYLSPYQLWLVKSGIMDAEDISDVPQVYWGNMHEESIVKHYEKVMNCVVKRGSETLYHKDHPFMLCHLDGEVEGQRKVLECKFAMFAKDNWGPSGSDEVPLPYIIQIQHQLAVTGYEEADLAVLIGGWDFRVYHFRRDEKLIAKIIKDLSAFWTSVENENPVSLRDRTDAALAYPTSNGNLVEVSKDIVEAINLYKQAAEIEKQAKKEKAQLADTITMHIKDADGIKASGQVLATWKATSRGNRVLRVMGE